MGAIVSVGCCYMHLTESARRADDAAQTGVCAPCDDAGVPMSRAVGALAVRLGYHAREMACHALVGYASRLAHTAAAGADAERHLETHARRALLECVFRRRCGANTRGLRAVKDDHRTPVCEYVHASLARLGIAPLDESERAELDAEAATCIAQWKRVVVYYVLRLLLAPLYEARALPQRVPSPHRSSHRHHHCMNHRRSYSSTGCSTSLSAATARRSCPSSTRASRRATWPSSASRQAARRLPTTTPSRTRARRLRPSPRRSRGWWPSRWPSRLPGRTWQLELPPDGRQGRRRCSRL